MQHPKKSDRVKKGLCVEVHNNNINKAWRRLKKMIQEDGIMA